MLEPFTKKNCTKEMKKKIRKEKVIKIKGDKPYVKSKDYHKSFNSWIDKKSIII